MSTGTKQYRGKRGGKRRNGSTLSAHTVHDVHSRVRGVHALDEFSRCTTASGELRAKYNEHAEIEETPDGFLVPRRSLTRQLLLSVFPRFIETERIPTRVLDHKTGELVEVKAYRVTWRSDRTLLDQQKVQQNIGTFKREGIIRDGLNTRRYREIIAGDELFQPDGEILGPTTIVPPDDIDFE